MSLCNRYLELRNQRDNVHSQNITDIILKKNKNVMYLKNYFEIKKSFYKLTEKKDFILNMGAGDCHNFWAILKNKNI